MSPAAAVALRFVNHVLAQNPWARDALRRHAGRTVKVVVAPLDFRLVITPEGLVGADPGDKAAGSRSHQGFSGNDRADICLSVPLSSLPQFALDPAGAMRGVHIEGDAELAQLLGQLVREVRWDAEDDLAQVVGDVAAHRLARDARSLYAYALDASQRLTETITAFLVDEDPTLVRRDALELWAADVSTLRDDCARLEKRLELIEVRLVTSADPHRPPDPA